MAMAMNSRKGTRSSCSCSAATRPITGRATARSPSKPRTPPFRCRQVEASVRGGSVPRRTRRGLLNPPGTGASRDTAARRSPHRGRCGVRSQPDAGGPGAMGGPEAPDESWDEAWRVNFMAHVWAARALLPEMVQRGEGYLVSTASAAGVLTQVSSAVYSVTKHAAVAFAEWLSIEYADAGIHVSCICPQGVRTPMLELAMQEPAGAAALAAGGLIEPEEVAEAAV